MSLDRVGLATRLAADIRDGWVVNLGIGLPTLVADHLPDGLEILLHTENGLLGMGPRPADDRIDGDLINAGKQPVTALPGASFFHTADSFGMMRGGHLDLCVLGAFQVSVRGDLANWSTGEPDAIPAVGGAMDLARGAREVWVLTDLVTRDGVPKLVAECSYPLTGAACVTRIYTDRAVFDVTPDGLAVRDLFDTTVAELEELLGLPLRTSEGVS
jgi:3-oxoadipate CoA-transferase beta subunit